MEVSQWHHSVSYEQNHKVLYIDFMSQHVIVKPKQMETVPEWPLIFVTLHCLHLENSAIVHLQLVSPQVIQIDGDVFVLSLYTLTINFLFKKKIHLKVVGESFTTFIFNQQNPAVWP